MFVYVPMGRIKRHREEMTTITVPTRFKELIEQEKMHSETISQRLAKIYILYKNNEAVFWFTQYEKVKQELMDIKNQKPWWID